MGFNKNPPYGYYCRKGLYTNWIDNLIVSNKLRSGNGIDSAYSRLIVCGRYDFWSSQLCLKAVPVHKRLLMPKTQKIVYMSTNHIAIYLTYSWVQYFYIKECILLIIYFLFCILHAANQTAF